MIVETESGSIYQIDGMRFWRSNDEAPLRRDGQWLQLLEIPCPTIGLPMVLVVEPLALEANATFRHTTMVTRIDYMVEEM